MGGKSFPLTFCHLRCCGMRKQTEEFRKRIKEYSKCKSQPISESQTCVDAIAYFTDDETLTTLGRPTEYLENIKWLKRKKLKNFDTGNYLHFFIHFFMRLIQRIAEIGYLQPTIQIILFYFPRTVTTTSTTCVQYILK